MAGQSMDVEDRILPLKKAAGLLGVEASTLAKWARSGRAAVLRTTPGRGGRVLILESEVQRLISVMRANADPMRAQG